MDQSAPTPQRCPTAWRVQPVSRELDVIQRADGSAPPIIPKLREWVGITVRCLASAKLINPATR